MKIEPISVTELNKYVKDKVATDEFLNNVCMPIAKAYEMVINNEIRDAKTQIVILKAYELIKSGKLTY